MGRDRPVDPQRQVEEVRHELKDGPSLTGSLLLPTLVRRLHRLRGDGLGMASALLQDQGVAAALVGEMLQAHVGGGETTVEAEKQVEAPGFGRFDHGPGFGHGQGRGLLTDDVDAPFQSGHHSGRMGDRRRHHVHQVERLGIEHLSPVRVNPDWLADVCARPTGHSHDIGLWDPSRAGDMHSLGDAAGAYAYQPDLDLLGLFRLETERLGHGVVSPFHARQSDPLDDVPLE